MGKFLLGLLLLFVVMQDVHTQSKSKNGNYYYKLKTYDRAIKGFERELKKNPDDENLLAKLADSYLKSNLNRALALPYATELVKKDPSVPDVLMYGKALFYSDKYRLALEQFEEVKKKTKSDSEEFKEAQQYSEWLINAQAYKNKPVDVSFINVGKKINTDKDELNPMVAGNDKLLMYSNNKRYHSKIGIYYYNICVSENHNLEWSKAKTIGSSINSGYDEIVSGLTKDGKTLFIHHNRDWIEQIGYASYLGNNKFSRMEPFDDRWSRKKGAFGVWQSSSTDTLLFVGETETGNTDIFYVLKLPNGAYGAARAVPGRINTPANEDFPVLTENGKRLYFSSNGSASMGGYDLFYSDWDEDKNEWGEPINLGYPVNDAYDNYTITHTNGARYAYVAAIRPEGYGERDIYKLVFNEHSAPNMILRCKASLQTDSGNIVPPYSLRAALHDSISGDLVGRYASSADSAKFAIALEPGKYLLNFYNKDSLLLSTPLNIPEAWFDNIPQDKEFILPKKKSKSEKVSK
ncbi:hypothetical protein [Saccharicrinis sp. GN24d3]|uniref:hypothetical protein n=1 Tax=Saccharicrinis sp. GN24d3 TaxID=3458416 RepID=UPI0040371825